MEKFNFKNFNIKKLNGIFSSLICIAIGLIIGLIILICMSPQDAFIEFGTLICGGINYFGIEGLFDILAKAAPLICCGLSVLFAYKTGLFNIGVAGQYVMGAFASLMFALQFNANWFVCLLMAAIFGAIWACIPGLLKSFCHVNEVISGIMCNWIGLFFMNYSFQTYLKSTVDITQGSKTKLITGSSLLPDFGLRDVLGNNFSIAIIVAIIMVVIIYIILNKTTLGYQLKASGLNKDATRYAGMNDKRNLIITMAIAGALAGLGAGLYYLAGIEQWSVQNSSSLPSMPWNGIVVAFIAQLNPIGVIFASLFTSLLFQGGMSMTQTIFPAEVGDLITGIIVYLSGLVAVIKILLIKFENKELHFNFFDKFKKKKIIDTNKGDDTND